MPNPDRVWTDDFQKRWIVLLDEATSFKDVSSAILRDFDEYAMADALKELRASTPEDWQTFRAGLTLERRKEFAGQEWAERWGHVLIPDVAIAIQQFDHVLAGASMPLGAFARRVLPAMRAAAPRLD